MKIKFSAKNMKSVLLMILKIFVLLFVSGIIVFYNDIILRPKFPMYDRQLRCFDHLIAGLIFAQVIKMYFKQTVFFSSLLYLSGCVFHEGIQIITKFRFQFDQYFSDILGVLIFVLFHIFILRSTTYNNIKIEFKDFIYNVCTLSKKKVLSK